MTDTAVDVDPRSLRFARILDTGGIETVVGHPPFVENPDGSTTSAAPETEPDYKKLADAGWYLLEDHWPEHDPQTQRVIPRAPTIVKSRRVIVQNYDVETIVVEDPIETTDVERRLNARIDGVLDLVNGVESAVQSGLELIDLHARALADVAALRDEVEMLRRAVNRRDADIARLTRGAPR